MTRTTRPLLPQALSIGALAALLAPAASASFTVTFSPTFHGAPCTQFAGWESFTQPNGGANAPDDPTTTSSGAAAYQLATGGVITAAGNLDNHSVAPIYRITDVAPADLQEVVLQVSMDLNPVDWSSFSLVYLDGGGVPQAVAPATSVYLVHQMGHDERVITWNLSGIADDVLAYSIDFQATNSFTTLDAIKLDARFACGPGIAFCRPGTAGTIACPCANPPSQATSGCDNSSSTGGARLSTSGAASLASDTLVFATSGEKPTALTILLQGDVAIAAGLPFGQGVRCVGGNLKRLYVRTASGGAVAVPQAGDPSVSSQAGSLGDPLASGQHRYYMAYYRDPIVLGGCPSSVTFNATDAQDVAWTP